jgi:hypothetical protein
VEYVAKRCVNGLFYNRLMKRQKKAPKSSNGVNLPFILIPAALYY